MSAREIDIHDRRNLIDVIRRVAYAETVYLGVAVLHQDMNVGYAVANMLPDLGATDRGAIDVVVNGAVEKAARRGFLDDALFFDIPVNDDQHHERLLAVIELYGYKPMTPSINKGCRTQVLVRLTQANPDMPGVNEKALQDLEDALNATDGMRAGVSSYLITGNPQDLLDGLQPADSEN